MTKKMNIEKYSAFAAIDLPNRRWPAKTIEHAPIWCSVDLRDGNQALIEPMNAERKLRMFELLLEMGIKEIEVGFPSASQPDYDFVRRIIEENRIPDDVTIQVLTPARDALIERTMTSIIGAKRAIVHVYNSTSTLQRRVVFRKDKAGIKEIASKAVALIRKLAADMPETDILLEYSPESFTGTELSFAKEICEEVMDVWGASPSRKVILNLPATVEMSTPNTYADQVEWMIDNVKNRDSFLLSVHPHNDRGTGVAAAELAMMAGCDRVEGTLFGNGERTGNVDMVNIALNMFSQGIEPGLYIDDIDKIAKTVEYCNQLPIHPRHPYVGELVFTAFSGSHQDAIKKGLEALDESGSDKWEVPYLPIDPKDLNRDYDAVIRVNSQSGKGGVAYLIKTDHGLNLPKPLQVEFSKTIQQIAEETGAEISSKMIWDKFQSEYLNPNSNCQLISYEILPSKVRQNETELHFSLRINGTDTALIGIGSGPIDAFINALKSHYGTPIEVTDFKEHAITKGAGAEAAAYVKLRIDGAAVFGAAIHTNTTLASFHAILNAIARNTK